MSTHMFWKKKKKKSETNSPRVTSCETQQYLGISFALLVNTTNEQQDMMNRGQITGVLKHVNL